MIKVVEKKNMVFNILTVILVGLVYYSLEG